MLPGDQKMPHLTPLTPPLTPSPSLPEVTFYEFVHPINSIEKFFTLGPVENHRSEGAIREVCWQMANRSPTPVLRLSGRRRSQVKDLEEQKQGSTESVGGWGATYSLQFLNIYCEMRLQRSGTISIHPRAAFASPEKLRLAEPWEPGTCLEKQLFPATAPGCCLLATHLPSGPQDSGSMLSTLKGLYLAQATPQ